jgi:hypothetical protein
MSETVTEYLSRKYSISKDVNFTLVEIMNACGAIVAKTALNELINQGRVKERRGANGIIIELILKQQ